MALAKIVQCFEGHPETAKFIPHIMQKYENDVEFGVDHQSVFEPPPCRNSESLSDEFFYKMCRALILDDEISILGGNDNDGNEDDRGVYESNVFRLLTGGPNASVRRNPDGTFTVLKYDYVTSSYVKLTLSFEDGPVHETSDYKVDSPELVDIKITDYCDKGCFFCYQGSTKEGVHAPLSEIKRIADSLAEKGVLEVALGGGEPTSHPNFKEILEYFSKKGIIPNYTSRVIPDGAVLRVPRIRGEMALSIDSLEEYEAASYVYLEYFHIIPDLWSMEDLKALFEKARERYKCYFIFLGIKTTGRMKGHQGGPRHDKKEMMELVFSANQGKYEDGRSLMVGVDTKFAMDYEIDDWGIPSALYYKQEGRYSMYIDAVTKTFGKSSFEEKMFKYENVSECLDKFLEWQEEFTDESKRAD
jgi:hypothetical protein